MTNDERRRNILTELTIRAKNTGAIKRFHERLKMAMGPMMSEAGSDAVELMGLVLALNEWAAIVAYGSINQPFDLQFREGDDLAEQMRGVWDLVCRDQEDLLALLKKEGKQIDPEFEVRVKAAPSNPSLRPDVKTPDPTTGPAEPENLDAIMAMLNSPGSGPNVGN